MGNYRPDAILKAVKKGRGGVFVSHHKLTADMETVRMPAPERVVLPMLQHIGAPCTPTVKKGDTVSVGQVIGDSDKFLSVPIHASVSGTVESIADVKLANGTMAPAVTIVSDGEMRLCEDLTPPHVETKEDLVKAVRASGLVGLGGAGFPSFVKITVSPDKPIDTLVVNAAECEPYITVDYRECLENSWNIMNGVYTLSELLGLKRVVIAVEDNKPEAIKILKNIADQDIDKGNIVRLMTLKSRYPQGAEKQLIQTVTGRQVPPGGLPADVKCIVMNAFTCYTVCRMVRTGLPSVERVVTVSGPGIANPSNFLCRVGTPVKHLIEAAGGFLGEADKLIMGGPMMGSAIFSQEVPILRGTNGVLAFHSEQNRARENPACIRCGRCVEACPMRLQPLYIYASERKGDVPGLKKLHATDCIECGCCAYSCPGRLQLVQSIRNAKALIKKSS